MTCQTCGNTMQNVAEDERGTIFFWCPRCGTLHSDRMDQGGDKTNVPMLVERCRAFAHRCFLDAGSGERSTRAIELRTTMLRTQAEIKEIAAGIVNRMVADIIYEFPTVRKTVDKLKVEQWRECLDRFTDEIEEWLLDKFGSAD